MNKEKVKAELNKKYFKQMNDVMPVSMIIDIIIDAVELVKQYEIKSQIDHNVCSRNIRDIFHTTQFDDDIDD